MSDKNPSVHQTYVLMGSDRSKPAAFQGSVEGARDWILENTRPSFHHNFSVYLYETMTYMSIPQFLEMPKKTPTLTKHLNNSIAFRELSEKNPAGENSEKVNHPSHYNTGNIEVIDAIEDWKLGFNTGNAVKYIARAEHKGKNVEDLRKAAWYINREIARLEGAVEEEVPKKGPRKIGSFGTGDDATLFIQSGGPHLSANQNHILRLKIDEARNAGKYAVMIIRMEDGGLSMWLTDTYPFGEIWMGKTQ